MQPLGPTELSHRIIDQNLCTLCGACADLCPYVKAHEGKISRVFSCDRQTGRCYAACPKTGIDEALLSEYLFKTPWPDTPLGHYREIHMARRGNKVPQGHFQNGGTTSALVMSALEQGVIDAAVLTGSDGLRPRPRLVTTALEVLDCTASKYIAAPTVACLNRATGKGYQNLGIVGTPCQMTGLSTLRTNPLDLPDFKDVTGMTIGLFCTWALETEGFLDYLLQQGIDPASVQSMEIPPPPAENVLLTLEKEVKTLPLAEIRKRVLPGCAVCPDMTALFCDLSVGAFEEDPAWNTLIVRSERGQALVDKAIETGFLEIRPLSKTNIDNLTLAAANKRKRALAAQERLGMLAPGFQEPLEIEAKQTITGFK
ncbi:putative coenzyme F420 hydrogenase, beta subunit (8-hydroxy-5-deazaflavin-reducing hydrogenase, beta subunit) (FRH) [Desulforapulum autotrophicum HRM2]|uniref:Coenzyme F420 hydrogenase, beta subunit (8-hydroxy-5-deazaflavin-reducing hydrogenase, beta subunit) (FRH) n=1 Tax=Desulforapulum autotrophicum (strain ATCC 43914 / DSM 3382 / VKM B-1955 / HRM2) TaxID=177437 RepID=C0QMA8_DESAH|nr:Coenzyme F420 hydrogenase/dehydrogenase, beta subunit C-terminal domain [Desulforapulum autotrophicum]ACN16425.1 putative coenzyme F420 hydrogenase, beta subunit (8-hydroxy-5-deazaflavin-reducing hydrogenase, beta subunit) (FRH) [Desulforapulum autotrophicum HRM2]